jgi:hypothetical protein
MIYLGLCFPKDDLPKQYPQSDARATRLSQIAAVLLIDPCTIDIRRVGFSVLANTRCGVF